MAILALLRNTRTILASPQAGFDARRVVCQMGLLQAGHYLLLLVGIWCASAALHPSLSATGTAGRRAQALQFAGGSANVANLLDWRYVAANPHWDPWTPRTTLVPFPPGGVWLDRPATGGKQDLGTAPPGEEEMSKTIVLSPSQIASPQLVAEPESTPVAVPEERALGKRDAFDKTLQSWTAERIQDPIRPIAILVGWLLALIGDVALLVTVVRRPSHMLDHLLTLQLIHVVLVWIYSRSLPASPRYWLLAGGHTLLATLASEFLAARTTAKQWEARSAAAGEYDLPEALPQEQHEMIPRETDSRTQTDPASVNAAQGQGHQFVLFDEEETA